MDKQKIRKSLSRARHSIKPLTTKLSHKDIKHVNDGMQYIKEALNKANPTASQTFFKKLGLQSNLKNKTWTQTSNGVSHEVTTQDMLDIINHAGNYIKHNF